MKSKNTNVQYMAKNVQINYESIFTPSAAVPGADEKFSVQIVADKDSEFSQRVHAIQDQIGETTWGDTWPQVKRQLEAQDRLALRDGDIKGGNVAGKNFMNASNKSRPLVINRDRTPLAETDNVIYNGCNCNVKIELWAQNHPSYGKRINAKLLGVQFHSDGEPFTPGSVATPNDFEIISDDSFADLA